METLWQDLRYGARQLARSPGFTAVAVLTLALGIGANTAIFSVINAVLLRPLPFYHPDRLVYIWTTIPSTDTFGTSYADFQDWKAQSQVFEDMAASSAYVHNLSAGEETEEVRRWRVSANMFQVLGVTPLLGRAFLSEEEEWGRHRVLVLSYGLWQRRFGGVDDIVGTEVRLDGVPYTVVGVLPPQVFFPGQPVDIWVPLAFPPGDTTPTAANRGYRFLAPVIARLKPGVTVVDANREIKAIARRLAEASPESNRDVGARVIEVSDWNTRDVQVALWVLMGAVGFVLLIACINVAALLLARGASREREIAIRAAVGASRGRLIRQLLTESGLLALVGGGLGVALSYWTLETIAILGPTQDVPRLDLARLDSQALGVTLGLTLLTCLLFGLIPALSASRPGLQGSIVEGGRTPSVGRKGQRVFRTLVVTEVGLALILLTGAGLLAKSFALLRGVSLGFSPENVLAVRVRLTPSGEQSAQAAEFYRRLLSNVEGLPAVESAGAGFPWAFPLRAGNSMWSLEVEGQPAPADAHGVDVGWRQVTPGFFSVLRIPLKQGRLFTEQDERGTPFVVTINETLAKRVFPEEDPIGKRIRLGGHPSLMTIIGIVSDTKMDGLNNPTEGPVAYAPHGQEWRGASGEMWVLARTPSNPASLAGFIKEQVHALDKNVSVSEVTTMEQIVGDSLAERRFSMSLLSLLAGAALLLAVVGIYGVAAYSVSQRVHEIGIRMTLGAQRSDISRLVVGRGIVCVALGLIFGLTASLALTHFLASLLYGVTPSDPLTFAAMMAVMAAAGWLANWVPARRAARVDPMVALRYE